jgi:hypothetical protein
MTQQLVVVVLVVVVAAVLELKATLRPHLEQQTQAAVAVAAGTAQVKEQAAQAAPAS